MLRDFVYNPDKELALSVLQDFKINLPHEPHLIALTRFEIITPDSFMWRLLIDGTVYYLYAEDFVRGLAYLKSTINSYLESDAWEFVAPKRIKKFEETSPIAAATTYSKEDDTDAMMKHASDSGFDLVFLISSEEDPHFALFSDHAPRGYSQEA